jgi:hypothetical protein
MPDDHRFTTRWLPLGRRIKTQTKALLKKLFTSVPFITYLVMIRLSFANLNFPDSSGLMQT